MLRKLVEPDWGNRLVATIGAAGVEVVQQVVADTQSALQPLISYLDTLHWLFIAVALIGVSITV
ncbi:MAG: hypothetical protein L3J36_16000 [Rhodobacteraceae bacterium]|nr:hypothetical protein [Paracoccaceae bacterium]